VTTNFVPLAKEGKTPMLSNLLLPVAFALTLALSIGQVDEKKPQEAKNEQGIRAEVRGILHFENGAGYFIAVNPTDKAAQATQVWLRAAEDKELVRKMQELDGKEVIAKGNLAQMPKELHASVPPLGIYLEYGFSIERAGAKYRSIQAP
jgi:hypothetical protein